MASGSASAPIPYALLHGTDETFDQDIDQLASSDDEAEAQSSHDDSVPFPQKRPAGGSYLPMDRLESILQADGTTGQIPLTKEGLFLLSIATEEFIKRFANGGQEQASSDRRSIVTYGDISSTVKKGSEFRFLKEIVPSPMSLKEALSLREKHQKLDFLADDTPLLLPRSAMPPPNQHFPPSSSHPPPNPGQYHYQVPPHALAAAASGSLPPMPPHQPQVHFPPPPQIYNHNPGMLPPGGTKMGRMAMNGHPVNGTPYPGHTDVLPLAQPGPSSLPLPLWNQGQPVIQQSPELDDPMDYLVPEPIEEPIPAPPPISVSASPPPPSAAAPATSQAQPGASQTSPPSSVPPPAQLPVAFIESLSPNERQTLENLAIELRAAALAEERQRSSSAAPSASPPVQASMVQDATDAGAAMDESAG